MGGFYGELRKRRREEIQVLMVNLNCRLLPGLGTYQAAKNLPYPKNLYTVKMDEAFLDLALIAGHLAV